MKKIVMSLIAVPIIVVATIGTMLVAANRVGENAQRSFFDAVSSEDPDILLALLHESTHAEIDRPVLLEWMKTVNARLGKFKGISPMNFSTDATMENGVRRIVSTGTMLFERGKASSTIVYADDKIVKFSVDSPLLEKKWFTGPANTQLYRERAVGFMNSLCDQNPADAFQAMHEELQKEVPLESMVSMTQDVHELLGTLQGIEVVGDQFSDAEGLRLSVKLKVLGAKAECDAMVEFQFVNLRGVLIKFELIPRG